MMREHSGGAHSRDRGRPGTRPAGWGRHPDAGRWRLPLLAALVLLILPASLGLATPPAAPPKAGERAEGSADQGQGPELHRILEEMDATYRKIETYQADFVQVSVTASLGQERKSTGRIFFRKPDRMRWTYLRPERREIFLTKKQVEIYLPDRNQVYVRHWSDTDPGMASARLFMGVKELTAAFKVSLVEEEEGREGVVRLRLRPRKKEGLAVEEVLLTLGREDFLPVRTETRDLLGNRTTLSFHGEKVNRPLDDKVFDLAIPPTAERMEDFF